VGVVITASVPSGGGGATGRPAALVWVDSREAVIVRLTGGRASVERLASDVPAHRRSMGHVSHGPSARHAGGRDQTAGEPRRLEHLGAFLEDVAKRIPADADLIVLGPGTVRYRLVRRLRTADAARHAARRVESATAGRMSDRQLIAHLRHYVGLEARHHTVGRYRWSVPPVIERSAHGLVRPYRPGGEPQRNESGRSG
jgi:hypothetical protein